MPVAVFKDSRLQPPDAILADLPTAIAWGHQQWKGAPFIVRIIPDDAEDSTTPEPQPEATPQNSGDSSPTKGPDGGRND